MQKPIIINFLKIGSEAKGFLVPFEDIPFPVEHVYCIGPVPESETRGQHAKKRNTQVLVAIGGKAEIYLEAPNGDLFEFVLEGNDKGLLIPAGYCSQKEFSYRQTAHYKRR